VRGHQLLLFADRVHEAERVHAEAEHPDERDRQQRQPCAERQAHALAHTRGREHQERQHDPRGHLHAHARRQRRGGR